MARRVSSYDRDAPLPGIESIWVWGIDGPAQLIRVVEVFWNGEEWWVRTVRHPQEWPSPFTSSLVNDVGLFWESCTPVRQTRTPRPPAA